ncbi:MULTISPECIES: pantetheine-phosphate adenylyltransferase [Trueperella]|uniref:Phosphopantetheine adenylyltransferase n=1 Tax=Trueperella bernardiae TaxID=59561 RepID=A0A0W1KJJ5_9ACTO|nr:MULTISPECIES: pantetheine-phosphate adenylyltransferase [Trueperella]KTF03853.1 Phosphopantetheine adenylyltransferase [Trueperella bernardiae]MCM3908139.1 pantetheine-phosphate adenylyltransferase [Trueperella bernardiae]MDK8602177.1 pantetheine-phosphate adenylyltransferase [Trueperella bernardiae]MDV6239300.1 pantetheine-phosphate adenylyltransferase [Trueperella bernardiae]OCW59928.1 phosphopantetheine adenylyltransferase [Trueperella bernardiae]
MTLAVCPGSFDPLTLGHIDVIERARGMFDEVVVAVSHNAKKTYLFSLDERVELAREALAGVGGVRVEAATGLIADFARERRAAAIVKGLRGAADYDAEQAMALLNRHLSHIETVFVMGDPALSHIASSFVKEIASYGGTIDDLVTPNVARALRKVNS